MKSKIAKWVIGVFVAFTALGAIGNLMDGKETKSAESVPNKTAAGASSAAAAETPAKPNPRAPRVTKKLDTMKALGDYLNEYLIFSQGTDRPSNSAVDKEKELAGLYFYWKNLIDNSKENYVKLKNEFAQLTPNQQMELKLTLRKALPGAEFIAGGILYDFLSKDKMDLRLLVPVYPDSFLSWWYWVKNNLSKAQFEEFKVRYKADVKEFFPEDAKWLLKGFDDWE